MLNVPCKCSFFFYRLSLDHANLGLSLLSKANGRDDETYPTAAWAAWAASRDIMAPYVKNGVLQYAHMEVAVSEQGEESLIVRSKVLRPPPALPVTTVMPRGSSIMASAH